MLVKIKTMIKGIISIKTILYVFCLLSFLDLNGLNKTQANEVLQEADAAFENENFDLAIEKYSQLIDNSFTTVALYHNLGLSYFHNGNLSKAILNMERAARLAPYNKNVKHNLSLIKENVKSEFSKMTVFFIKDWYLKVVKLTSSLTWFVFHFIFLAIAIVLFYFYLIKGFDFNLHRSYMIGLIISLAVLAFVFSAFSYSRNHLIQRNDVAIVLKDNSILRIGAEENSQEIKTLNEGEKIYIIDKINSFLKVKMEDLSEGWIEDFQVERI